MSKYQYSKLVMEKFLRRSFYDAVLELYETSQGIRIISVSLEGNLNLVVNKDENFLIKLNEVAQRADDREDNIRYKEVTNFKLEGFDHYGMKKEENSVDQFPQIAVPQDSAQEMISVGLNYKLPTKENKDGGESSKGMTNFYNSKSAKYNESLMVEDKVMVSKGDSDSFEKSSETESESEEEGDIEMSSHHNHHPSMVPMESATPTTPTTTTAIIGEDKVNHEFPTTEDDDICFVPVGQYGEYSIKKKFEFKDQELLDHSDKKSPHSRKRKALVDESEEDVSKLEERDKQTATTSSASSVDDSGGLQLLPHTATGPIIVEEEENSFSNGVSESQMAQLALLQMREQNLNVNMFRPQDLEELARQQQQWQMVAYQRSIMEKSYLQHHMQVYQRDTERLRWEYVAQQARDYPQTGDDVDKAYKQSTNSQNTNSEVAILATPTTLLDDPKKAVRESNAEMAMAGAENLSSQYMRMFSDDPSTSQLVDADYEEGELRPEVHNCALCETKFASMDLLLRHMEKHRAAFERSCSVCQLGTLTGNMLILHMEASHGPDTSYPLPLAAPSTTVATPQETSVTSAPNDYGQMFSTPLSSTTGFTGLAEQPGAGKLSQQQQQQQQQQSLLKQNVSKEVYKSDTITDVVKSEMLPLGFTYTTSTTTSTDSADAAAASPTTSQENFLGISPQFYPLIVCQFCGEKFALSEALDQHVEGKHNDAPVTYSCKVCPLTFPKHTELSKHLTKHETSSTNLKCSHCLKSFKSVKQLRLHYVAAHACCHFCEYCRAGFPDAMALQLHEQLHTLDPEKLTFRCDICNKAFYTQSQCSAHKRTHKEEKAHTCELCGSAFFKRGDLTKHTRTVHLPSRLFACKFCGKKGTRMDNMRSHVRSHHKNMSRDQIINMIEVIE